MKRKMARFTPALLVATSLLVSGTVKATDNQAMSFSTNMCANSFVNNNDNAGASMMGYCKQVADSGDMIGAAIMGEIYLNGHKGVGKNYNKAYQWFSTAAEQGHVPSIAEQGRMQMLGLGTFTDIDSGIKLIDSAFDSRSGKAAYYKSVFYLNEELYDQSLGLSYMERVQKVCELNLIAVDYGYNERKSAFDEFISSIVSSMPNVGAKLLLECTQRVEDYHRSHKDLFLYAHAGKPLADTWKMPKGPFPVTSPEFWLNIIAPKD
ncbi:SEL1-like repeat protein [Psychromonas sp. SP041]|uniref:tetratricopeptide repeat protein n=1 Tax=Psychromonas sp. SP041 TaxID=1365007 RepID=UPI0010C792BC|nr:SEL1-like repeat protein [Psychromonas sp. SP041]